MGVGYKYSIARSLADRLEAICYVRSTDTERAVQEDLHNSRGFMNHQVIHPMVKFQRQVRSLVDSQIVQPSDRIWKIAFLFGEEWSRIKQELLEFEFSMQDPISELLAVEVWEEDE